MTHSEFIVKARASADGCTFVLERIAQSGSLRNTPQMVSQADNTFNALDYPVGPKYSFL